MSGIGFNSGTNGSLSREVCKTLYFANSFSISVFIVRPLIHWELNFVQDDGYSSDFILLHEKLYFFPIPFVENALFSSM